MSRELGVAIADRLQLAREITPESLTNYEHLAAVVRKCTESLGGEFSPPSGKRLEYISSRWRESSATALGRLARGLTGALPSYLRKFEEECAVDRTETVEVMSASILPIIWDTSDRVVVLAANENDTGPAKLFADYIGFASPAYGSKFAIGVASQVPAADFKKELAVCIDEPVPVTFGALKVLLDERS